MDTQQAIVEVTERPKVGDLITEFKRNGSQGDQFGRMLRAEDVRLARWDGQSEDGKKHAADQPDGEEVFPWEGASDVRDYLADQAVNESSDLCCNAFWEAILKIVGAQPNDLSSGSSATEYIDWMVHFQLLKQLDNEVELSAQYMYAIGATALHVTWEREVGRKLQPFSLENAAGMLQGAKAQLQQAVQASGRGGAMGQGGAPGQDGGGRQSAATGQGPSGQVQSLQQLISVLEVLPQLVLDPSLETEAMEAVTFLYGEYVHKQLPPDIQESEVLLLSKKRARQAVKDLRSTGTCEFPMPYLAKNQPKISALKPYRDIVLPVEVGSIESSPVVFVRDLMTEAQLRGMVLGANWDADWVEEAVKTKGKFSTWQLNNPYSAYGTWSWRAVDNRSWLIEVVYAYYRQIDEDGVTQITVTVFSPHLTRDPKDRHPERAVKDKDGNVILDDFAGKFEILNYPRPEYPVILGRRERFDRSWLATRGLAEILATDQNVEKAMLDNVVDLAGITTVPPLLVPKGLTTKYKIGPAVQNEYVPGREPKWMAMEAQPGPAEAVIASVRGRMARYCGLFDQNTPPQVTVQRQKRMVKSFLIMWGEALQMAYELTAKFAPEKIQSVTDQAPTGDPEDFHYVMQFDATQFHPELMEAKMAAFSELAQQDRTGVIDQTALTKFKAMMIDPAMAKDLVIDQGQASTALMKGVQADVAQMFLGNEAIYDDASNDPAAQMKLQYASKVLQSNPNYLKSLDPDTAAKYIGGGPQGQQLVQQMKQMQLQSNTAPDPRFSALVENYIKNLMQGTAQQQNKKVGRTGVKQLT